MNAILCKKNIFVAILLCCTLSATSQCTEESQLLQNLQDEYNVLFVDLEKQGEVLRKAMPDSSNPLPSVGGPHISFDVKMKRQRFSFDIIEVIMKNKKMSLSLPSVTMKAKSFSIPTTKAQWKVTRLCCGIRTKTLVITNGMKKISFKLPEVKMNVTEIITKIPEFTKKPKEIIFDIPEFTMKSPVPDESKFNELQAKTDAISKKADTLNMNAAALGAEQKEKARTAITNLFSCLDNELVLQKLRANESYEEGFAQLNAAIASVKSHNLNPEKVKSDDGTETNLLEVRSTLTKTHQETISNIDATAASLKEQLAKIINDLNT